MHMKKILLLCLIIIFSGCSILFPNHFERKSANYILEDIWVTSTLDYNKNVKYLINSTQQNYLAKSTDGYNEYVIDFFNEEFKNQSYLKRKYKDANGKIVIPLKLNYHPTQEYLDIIKQTTDIDYLVLTKISSAEQINKSTDSRYNDLKFQSNLLAGSVVFLKIMDLKNNTTPIEIQCQGSVYDSPNFNFDTNSYEDDGKIATYKSEEQLIKKCFKRIFRRIK